MRLKILIMITVALAAIIAAPIACKASITLTGLLLFILFFQKINFINLLLLQLALLCLLPESGRELFPSFISFADIILLLISSYWFINIILKKNYRIIKTPLNIACLLLFLSAALAIFVGISYSANVQDAFVDFLQRFGYIIVFFVMVNNLRGAEPIERIIRWTIILAGIISFYGILQFFLGFMIIEPVSKILGLFGYYNYTLDYIKQHIWWSLIMVKKPYQPFFGPNSLGGFLLLVFPLGLKLFIDGYYLINKALLRIILISIYLCLILTYSRTCQVALIAVLMVFLYLELKRKRASPKIILVIIIATIILPKTILIGNQKVWEIILHKPIKITDEFSQLKYSNIEKRIREIKKSLQLFEQHPILGIGFSTGFTEEGEVVPVGHYIGVSNLYLEIVNKMGIVGLSIFFYMILALFQSVMPIVIKNTADASILFGLTLSIMAALANGLFDHTFISTPALVTLFWLFTGLIFVEKMRLDIKH